MVWGLKFKSLINFELFFVSGVGTIVLGSLPKVCAITTYLHPVVANDGCGPYVAKFLKFPREVKSRIFLV